MHDTRSNVIFRHVDLALRNDGRLTRESFAQDVVDLYHERTPLHLRRMEFTVLASGGNPYDVQRANAQLLFRMLKPDGAVRLASEVEESVVLSLPEPYRGECMRDLAARYGLLAAGLPASGGAQQLVCVGGLAREFGQALTALAKTAGDGHLEPSDAAHAPEVIRELDDLIAAATTLRVAHADLLPPGVKRAESSVVREFSPRSGREV